MRCSCNGSLTTTLSSLKTMLARSCALNSGEGGSLGVLGLSLGTAKALKMDRAGTDAGVAESRGEATTSGFGGVIFSGNGRHALRSAAAIIQRVANSKPTGRIHRWHEAVGSAGIPTVMNSFENFNATALNPPNLSETRFRDHIVRVFCPRWLNPNGAKNRSHRGAPQKITAA